ncbi:MAG: Xaa-Pro peptidase family protein, partial [Candidatus Spechtbacterales bacterium]
MEAEVVLQRIDKVREQMREQGVDALIIPKAEESSAVDIPYLSGFNGSAATLIVTLKKAVLVVDSRYIYQARQEIRGIDVVGQTKREELFEEIIPRALKDAKRLGVMKQQLLAFGFYLNLVKHLPHLEIIPLPAIARTGRIVKDEEEILKIKRSVRATERALRHAFSVIQPGVTELVAAEAFRSALPPGAKLAFPSIVISGKRSVFIHGNPTKKRIKRGDVVLLDVGCILPGDDGGYVSDLSRVVVCGTASPEQKRMHRAIIEAIDESLELYKPGLKTFTAHERA